jgi:pyruvate formate lyase activating enzyme
MLKGIVFDIKEFAVFDGPGIRTTVFFKGCPLRCAWCHNPEGWGREPELMVSRAGCTLCGRCEKACPSPGHCRACGACVAVCPQGLRRIVGLAYEAGELAAKLLRDADYLRSNGGGYTFSGGEPLDQGEFLLELLGLLRGNHRVIETSGFCGHDLFRQVAGEADLVMMDLKLAEGGEHRRWTGADNGVILENLETLKAGDRPFIIRIPVIPGVNDGEENFRAVAKLLRGSRNLLKVELLPYHKTAGAKYGMLGLRYEPGFDTERKPGADTRIFEEAALACTLV